MTEPTEPPTAAQEAEDQQSWELQDAQDKSKLLRPLFSNRIYAQPDGLHLRVSFGEHVADESIFHTALVIPNSDALAFGNLLVRLATAGLENHWAYLREIIAQEDAPDTKSDG